MKVCIDCGHAKSTAGKRAFDESFFEYEFNRDVGQRLAHHLKRHGISITYSCDLTVDYDESLGTRCKRANDFEADIFVSIHANAFGTDWNDANGWEIFCYGKPNKLAQCIHEASRGLGLTDRGIKDGSHLGVIKGTRMTAVLIEHGFYTNREELKKLKSAEWREKFAVADAKGILKYFGVEWVDDVDDVKNDNKTVSESLSAEWNKAVELGITDGSRPQDFAKREEVVAMIVRTLKLM